MRLTCPRQRMRPSHEGSGAGSVAVGGAGGKEAREVLVEASTGDWSMVGLVHGKGHAVPVGCGFICDCVCARARACFGCMI